jgi:L-ascorbate metabolism protein UlaG (beta-lactamase superfamily)
MSTVRGLMKVTATPCRHGPPLLHLLSGPTIGFALGWEGQPHGVVWISGDTVLYSGVREIVERLEVDVALLHLGSAGFPLTGPLLYSMTASEGVQLCRELRPRTAIPIHYEGWQHFRQGREAIERELAHAPADVRERFRWLPIGSAMEIG